MKKSRVPFFSFNFRHFVPILLLATALLTGCASSQKVVVPTGERVEITRLQRQFMAFFNAWEGTPYRYGGRNRRGIDCSAFTQMAYREILHIRLPRTTGEQVRTGKKVSRDRLQIGDLVFFRTKPLHVGIYLGDNRFMHASTSSGVMLSSLTEPYWHARFLTARRHLSSVKETKHQARVSNETHASW